MPICAGADRLSVEVALAEAIATFGRLSSARSDHTRPVRRAVEYLRERLVEPITLDDLAAHASLDKFHLCRAFRARSGCLPTCTSHTSASSAPSSSSPRA
ncbi:hypothetical protein WMF45_46680 [Sorangium sp. So ce448]|uniref:hypothetical protein n=1 Tax=Sorangium sp. So ce448 TaxID=3133314 RepID=UPI003F617BEE